jgi:hypothetical protein
MVIWSILWPFGIFCGHKISRFGIIYQEKSGNPEMLGQVRKPACSMSALQSVNAWIISSNHDTLERIHTCADMSESAEIDPV